MAAAGPISADQHRKIQFRKAAIEILRLGVARRDREFLCGVLCGTVLTLAGVAIAHENAANDTVKPLIVLPGGVPRYSGQQGREADITELLATSAQTGGKLGIFRQTIAPGSGPNIGTNPGVLLFGVTPGGFEKMFADRQGVDADTNKRLMERHHMQVVGPPLP